MRSLPILILSLLPTIALAQGTNDQRGACMKDAFKLCSAVIPDEAAIEACLERNLTQLTPTCRAQFDTPTPEPAPVKRAAPSSRKSWRSSMQPARRNSDRWPERYERGGTGR